MTSTLDEEAVSLEHWFYIVPLRLRFLFRRRQVEQELDKGINGVAVFQPASRLGIGFLYAPQVYTSGWRYVPGTNPSDPNSWHYTDAVVVKLDESPSLTLSQ